jgi:2-polyprenyl-3-methyl-5-hydroxy-6-metoxy-1,4-benzoquinol methylase
MTELFIHRIYRAISPLFRRRRMRRFLHHMRPTNETTILDVGGYPGNWEGFAIDAKITLLNVHRIDLPPAWIDRRMSAVVGDGCNLPYEDQSFDIVFSNSVIEHVGDWGRQVYFAAEMRRVGKSLWIQTPARNFFVEPHLLTPFVHFLPIVLQRRLLRRFTIWGIMTKPTPAEVHAFFEQTRLITAPEMRKLFPDCEILRERFAGLTKSFIAIRDGRRAVSESRQT